MKNNRQYERRRELEDEFHALVKKGRGEAILWLKEEKHKEIFVPVIRDAALHDYRYDRVAEQCRADYIYALIKELNDCEQEIERICTDIEREHNDIKEDFSHIIGVLSCLSRDGHKTPRRILTEKYAELFTSLLHRREMPASPDTECRSFLHILLAAVHGNALSVKEAVCDIGRLITENSLFKMVRFESAMFDLAYEYPEFTELSESDDKYIQKALSEYEICEEAIQTEAMRNAESIKERVRQFENIHRTIEVIREGKFLADGNGLSIRSALKQAKLEVDQKKELRDIALHTKDIDVKLFIYRILELPIDIKDMIAEAKKHDHVLLDPERTKKWDRECILAAELLNTLGRTYTGEDDIRNYAHELEERGMPLRYRLKLHSQILAKEDADDFFAYMDAIEKNAEGSEDLLHDITYTVLMMWDMREDIEPKPEFLWRIYDKVTCSGCRLTAVRLMEKYHCLPDRIREAAVYDCIDEIREIAKRYRA